MPVLAVSQQAARAAYLQVAHGNAEAGAEGGKLPYGRKPLGGNLGQDLVAGKGEVGIRLAGGTPHPPADLVQLAKPHTVGVFDDQRVAVAHVHAGFDQRGADQNVDFIIQQLLPDRGNLLLGHFAVGNADARTRHHLPDACGAGVNGFHAVVQVIHLPAARQLLADRLGNDARVIFQHIGFDGLTLKGRLLDRTHIAYARKRHIQRARNGRGGQRQHIHTDEILFQFFLVLYAETLLLVNDDQSQILELHIIRKQPVGTHHNVHGAVF